MTCDEAMARIGDRLTGDVDEMSLRALRQHLASCSGCATEAAALESLWDELGATGDAPTAAMRARLDEMLEREIARTRGTRSVLRLGAAVERPIAADPAGEVVDADPRLGSRPGRPLLALALAAGLAAASLGAGLWLGSRSAATLAAGEVSALREEIRSLRSTVALALLAERSPSERLSGVAHGRAIQAEDDRVADALFAALVDDSNVNVRLAALDALRELASRPEIRDRLLEAIPRQDSPLVQISAIDAVLEAARAAPAGPGGEPIEAPIDAGTRDQVARLAKNSALDAVVRGYLVDRLERSAP